MDIEAFSENSFNSIDWINDHFRSYPDKSNKSVFITSFVSKLQLYVQQVNFAVEDASNQVLKNLPRIIKDVKSLHSDVATLQNRMIDVRSQVSSVEKETGECMESLERLNSLQSRLQVAKDSLQESDGWGNLIGKLEDSFERNDLISVCEQIISLQKSLNAQEKLPGHSERLNQVEDFKNRLEALASPIVVQCFVSGDADAAQKYTNIFGSINRLPQLLQYYRAVQKNSLQQSWKEMVDLSDGCIVLLNNFYELLWETFQKQSKWCSHVFGEDNTKESLYVIIELLPNLQPSREAQILQTLKGSNEILVVLQKVADSNRMFANQLQSANIVFQSNDIKVLSESIFDYFTKFINQYPKFEEQLLNTEIEKIAIQNINTGDAIRSLEKGNNKLFEWIQEACERCEKITDNYELGHLIPYLNGGIKKFLENYSKVVRQLELCIKHEENWSLMQNCLSVLQYLGDFQIKLTKFEKKLADNLSVVNNKFINNANEKTKIRLRIRSSNADIQKYLKITENHSQQNENNDGTLGLFSNIFESLKRILIETHDLTLKILLSPIELQLKNIQPTDETHPITTTDLPDFSYAPQECITQIGQYLLTLPQHLEPLLLSPSNSLKLALETCNIKYSQIILCADILLSLVVEQCCFLYQSQILQLKSLSNVETKQLCVDIEYFKNIIEELGLTATVHLNQILILLKASSENYLSLSSGCEPRLVTAIRQMRNIISTE